MTHLPDLSLATFTQRLRRALPEDLAAPATAAVPALYAHYQELRRWAPKLSLVGPGTAAEVVERHYAESLAALPLLAPGAQTLVDVGSGAGFPGFVLAAAVPGLEVTLIEPRERRWAFLGQAVRSASRAHPPGLRPALSDQPGLRPALSDQAGLRPALNCRCLNVRVATPLPAGLPERIDILTFRALRPEPAILAPLAERLSPQAQVLVWAGEDDPAAPPGFAQGRTVRLPGATVRRLFEIVRTAPA